MKKYVLTMVCALLTLSVHAQPKGVVLDTLNVQHIDFQGQTRQGTIICNRKITNDLRAIFEALYKAKYPIERIQPISDYDNDDERSMQANNTSCYCYRPIEGSKKLSNHALGMAIDINESRAGNGNRHQPALQPLHKKKEGRHPARPTFYCSSLRQPQQDV